MGIHESGGHSLTWQKAYAERVIRSIRRECSIRHVANERGTAPGSRRLRRYYLNLGLHIVAHKDAPLSQTNRISDASDRSVRFHGSVACTTATERAPRIRTAPDPDSYHPSTRRTTRPRTRHFFEGLR